MDSHVREGVSQPPLSFAVFDLSSLSHRLVHSSHNQEFEQAMSKSGRHYFINQEVF